MNSINQTSPRQKQTSSNPSQVPVNENLKIDVKTGLVSIFYGMFYWGGWVALACLVMSLQKHGTASDLKWFLLCLTVSICGWILLKLSNSYYILNSAEKTVYHYSKFLSWERTNPVLAYQNIAGITVSGMCHVSRSNNWYEYKICAIDLRGNKTFFSDSKKKEYLDELNKKAELIARSIGCEFFRCLPENVVQTQVTGKGCRIFFKHCPIIIKGDTVIVEGTWKMLLVLLVILIALVVYGFTR